MWIKVQGLALLVLLLGACGGHAREAGDQQVAHASSSGADQATGGTAATGVEVVGNGGASVGASGSGTVGAASGASGASGAAIVIEVGGGTAGASAGARAAARAALPCDNPTPRPLGGGYEICGDGSLRRPSAGACEASLPRAAPDVPIVFDECMIDSDCTSAAYGFCAYGACKYGCVVDGDCASGQACFCGDSIGTCILATCRSDADCPAAFPCTTFLAVGFATPDELACQSPSDACITDAECHSLNPRVSCVFQIDHRICLQSTVG